MQTEAARSETDQEWTPLSPLSGEQWETLEEAGDGVGRTPGEIEHEIVQDAQELGALLARPHPLDGAMAEELLGVSDELRHVAEGERPGGDPVGRFGRRPPPIGKA